MSTKGKRRQRAAAREAKAFHPDYNPVAGPTVQQVSDSRTFERERDRNWWRYDEHPHKKEDR